jgi:hypothetical protein
VIERVAPNGTVVETLEVYDNESIRIVQGNNTNTTATTATANGSATTATANG